MFVTEQIRQFSQLHFDLTSGAASTLARYEEFEGNGALLYWMAFCLKSLERQR